jgi:excisionase family DNA binding protein
MAKGSPEKKLLTIDEAARLLGVSRATFNLIRKENDITEIMVGKRPRFLSDELITVLSRRTSSATRSKKTAVGKTALNILSDDTVEQLEVRRNVFDIRLLAQVDAYGALSLLCALLVRAKTEKRVELLIDDRHICQYLKTIHFFYHLEREDKITWDQKILQGAAIQDTSILMPIKAIRAKGGERIIAEQLLKLLRQQGFKDSVGRAIAIILGELADNTMTHSHDSLSERVCYVSAKRFLWGESNCIIVGIADPGQGIPSSLRKNPDYRDLSDKQALLDSFKSYVTSWRDSPRGKGLTDVLSIALGNRSLLRVDTGGIGLSMDLQKRDNPQVSFVKPMASVSGTRFGLILIDTSFEKTDRKEADALINKKKSEL